MRYSNVGKRPTTKVPGTGTLLLTSASKMPCLSWSLPAGESCPWALYGEGTICDGCYADKGMYTTYPCVKNAQRARFAWTRESLKTADGRNAWVALMVRTIAGAENPYFRVHDSGDLFSPEYVEMWVAVCAALPNIKFWFPTRAWRPLTMKNLSAATRDRWALALSALCGLDNVTIRPSALFFNAPAPRIPGFSAGSTACDEGFNCPAPGQDNACLDCRACWDRPDVAISYHRH